MGDLIADAPPLDLDAKMAADDLGRVRRLDIVLQEAIVALKKGPAKS